MITTKREGLMAGGRLDRVDLRLRHPLEEGGGEEGDRSSQGRSSLGGGREGGTRSSWDRAGRARQRQVVAAPASI